MIYLSNPNLPLCADIVLLGEKYREAFSEPLESCGIKPMFVPENPNVDYRLSSHADLSVFHAGGKKIFAAAYLKNSDFARSLSTLGFELIFPSVIQNRVYPNDCGFNICLFGNYALYNSKTAAEEITDCLEKERIVCNQGYSKCLVSVIDHNSIITSDLGIASQCRQKGIDVLQIEAGYIDLDGFEYGFIGGASFKLSEKVIVFTGLLDDHPDKHNILEFLDARGIQPVYLTDRKIFDVGSILPITEKQRI